MKNHIHHVHIFASNIDESVQFYTELFGGVVILDQEMAGARNIFIRIGSGRLHLYDQPPRNPGRASIHHFGIQTDDIEAMVERLKSKGVVLRRGIVDLGVWKYVMVPAPDDILIELFEVDKEKTPTRLREYFD